MNSMVMMAVLLSQTPAAAKARPEIPRSLDPVGTTIGVKIGPYQPNIDSESGVRSPYGDLFKEEQGIFVVGQLRRLWPAGAFNLGLTLSIGWVQQSAKAFVDDGDESTPSTGTQESGGETSIRVIPVSTLGVVRFNGFMSWVDLPIFPYLEAGPSYAFWRVGNGSGDTAASGGSLAWQFNAGLLLRLDGLEPVSAKALADQFGIQSTELTVEWSHLQTYAFGLRDQLHVGDSTFLIGLGVGF